MFSSSQKVFSCSGSLFSSFGKIFSCFGKLFSCFGKSKTSGGTFRNPTGLHVYREYCHMKSKNPLPANQKRVLNVFILKGMRGRLHHSAHAATHSTAHRRHSRLFFFFVNQYTFGSQEHASN